MKNIKPLFFFQNDLFAHDESFQIYFKVYFILFSFAIIKWNVLTITLLNSSLVIYIAVIIDFAFSKFDQAFY